MNRSWSLHVAWKQKMLFLGLDWPSKVAPLWNYGNKLPVQNDVLDFAAILVFRAIEAAALEGL